VTAQRRQYIAVDNRMPEHPKVESLSDKAFRLLVDLWCWCDRLGTDGLVPFAVWDKRGTRRARQELADARLADPADGGWRMHDYLGHQRSAEQIKALRDKRADAGRKGGKAKATGLAIATPGLEQTPSKAVADTETEEERTTANSLGEGNRHETLGAVSASEPPKCTEHRDIPPGAAEPACFGCKKAREAWQQARVDHALAVAEARANCPDCLGSGLREDPETREPIGKCDHRRTS
jgi:hypothetical protein